jgi:hypothetical protein
MFIYLWYPSTVSEITVRDINNIHSHFDSSITAVDCGEKCSPYNDFGVPFCCDIGQTVPTAYNLEWEYLRTNTDLWRLYSVNEYRDNQALQAILPEGQVLLKCLGHQRCKRPYRSISCRAFPFYPYITLKNEFIGLSYYWQYEDRCWVISNLDCVTPKYIQEFVETYDNIFKIFPEEIVNFRSYSIMMRQVFGRKKRRIPLLHRNGGFYKVNPRNGHLQSLDPRNYSKYGPYKITSLLKFPEEEVQGKC